MGITYKWIKITINDWFRESRNHWRLIKSTFYIRPSVFHKRNCFKRTDCCDTCSRQQLQTASYLKKLIQAGRLSFGQAESNILYHAIVRKFRIQITSTNHVGPSAANGACADLWSIAHFYVCVRILTPFFCMWARNLSCSVSVS